MSLFFVELNNIALPDEPLRDSLSGDGGSVYSNTISELSASIYKHGQLQPVLVVKQPKGSARDWKLVCGMRRVEAITQLNIKHMTPPNLFPGQVLAIDWEGVDKSAATTLEVMLTENVDRLALSLVEQARAEARLRALYIALDKVSAPGKVEPSKPTYSKLRSDQTGKSVKTIENLVAVGEASQQLQLAIEEKVLTFAGGADLAREDANVQNAVVDKLRASGTIKAGQKETSFESEVVKQNARAAEYKATSEVQNVVEMDKVSITTLFGEPQDILTNTPEQSVDCVIVLSRRPTTSYQLNDIFRVIKKTGHIFIMCEPKDLVNIYARLWSDSRGSGVELAGQIIWHYGDDSSGKHHAGIPVQHAVIMHFTHEHFNHEVDVTDTLGDVPLPDTDLLRYAKPETETYSIDWNDFPTMPEAVLNHLVVIGCRKGGTIMQIDAGHGQIIKHCRFQKRNLIATESNRDSFEALANEAA